MDACGASSSLSTSEKYDVFLSFRGEDTRDEFTSHLYAALDRKKIKTYIDEKNLERGDEISPALCEAIQNSKIWIIVFSENYASSSWCLRELVHILECHQEKMVIPIFYKMDPSHIRKQEGSYGDAFIKHEERFKDRMDIVHKWRDALTKSANLSGWDSRAIRPESKLVEAIVGDVLKKLNREQSSNSGFEGLIGIDKQIEEIKSLLSVCSPKVCIVGIWGMGGIGKTTLAQVIFNQLSSQFEVCSFVANVREESEKGSLINLRNKLLAELLKEEKKNVGTPSLIPSFVKERLKRTKVLIVLDDVNHVQQLNTFVGDRDQFSCESRIVITTRDASVLRDISVDGMYEVKQLEFGDALQLFNLIAFRGNFPIKDFIGLSIYVVKHFAGGIPLAITVLGSHFRSLRSQSKKSWETALHKLKSIPHDDIHKVLRISFDGLDKTEKDIFLDIACFFKGMSRDYIESILNACGFFATNGIDDLIDKSLITIQNDNIWMHDLLEEMGRKIVCEESAELGERSRLWIAEDVCQVLENNEGTAKIEGIFLDWSKIDEEIQLEPTIFKKMHNLRLLKIYGSFNKKKCTMYLQNGLSYLPRSLRYLEWHEYPLKSLPRNFKPKHLVELKMPYGQLEKLWDGVQDLNKLRSIDLRHSLHLTRIPDVSGAPNLERINLEYCTSLLQVPFHFLQNLNKLTKLNLSHCHKLQGIPDGIFGLESLRTLTLSGCYNLNTLPMIMSRNLVSLDLSSTGIMSLPPSIDRLNNLSSLSLNNCTKLADLPSNIYKLDSLKHLELGGCSILEKFPDLPWNIEELDISGTAIKEVASSSIEGRFCLGRVDMSSCKSLASLPTSIFKLTCKLYLSYCSNLESLPEILEPIESLEYLSLKGTGIRQLPSSIGKLIGVRTLNMDKCENLKSVPSAICNMVSLSELVLSNSPKLEYFPKSIGFLCSVFGCLVLNNSNIRDIPESIKGLSRLLILEIKNCKNLRSLPELPLSLEIFDASGCTSLEVVSIPKRALTQRQAFWDDHTIANITEFLVFSDCLKLDQSAQNRITIEFQLRVLRMAMRYVPQEDQEVDYPGVSACFPGNEIPEWFEYQAEGCCINIKLPPQWHDSNFLGFIVCAVADSYSNTQELQLTCELNFKPNRWKNLDFIWSFTDWGVGYQSLPTTTNSGHVYMWYCWDYGICVDAEELSFDFLFEECVPNLFDRIKSSNCEVKKCGIHMLYYEDVEKFIMNFMNNQHLNWHEPIANGVRNSYSVIDQLDLACQFNLKHN